MIPNNKYTAMNFKMKIFVILFILFCSSELNASEAKQNWKFNIGLRVGYSRIDIDEQRHQWVTFVPTYPKWHYDSPLYSFSLGAKVGEMPLEIQICFERTTIKSTHLVEWPSYIMTNKVEEYLNGKCTNSLVEISPRILIGILYFGAGVGVFHTFWEAVGTQTNKSIQHSDDVLALSVVGGVKREIFKSKFRFLLELELTWKFSKPPAPCGGGYAYPENTPFLLESFMVGTEYNF